MKAIGHGKTHKEAFDNMLSHGQRIVTDVDPDVAKRIRNHTPELIPYTQGPMVLITPQEENVRSLLSMDLPVPVSLVAKAMSKNKNNFLKMLYSEGYTYYQEQNDRRGTVRIIPSEFVREYAERNRA